MYSSVPKCLLVLHQNKESLLPIKDLLTVSRNLQFVDFTLIQAIRNKPPAIFYYNVSLNNIEMQNNITRSIRLFPDKLKNLNGYNLRVGVLKASWPTDYKDNKGYPLHLRPLIHLFKVHEHFASFLNVSSEYVPIFLFNSSWKQI